MNKKLKVTIGIIIGILLLYLIIFFIDYNRCSNMKEPIDGNVVGIPAESLEFNRNVENVTIEILKDTITSSSLEILITDNNEDQYGWGVEFRVQEKVNGEWKDLKYISDDLAWISIAYELNEDNQLKQKLDIEKYYGRLSNGIYRIVKPVYDKGYIDIYSNEFKILDQNKVTTIDIEKSFLIEGEERQCYTLNQEEIYVVMNIIQDLYFTDETCDGISEYLIKINTQDTESLNMFSLEIYDKEVHILKNSEEAVLTEEQSNELKRIIEKYFNK